MKKIPASSLHKGSFGIIDSNIMALLSKIDSKAATQFLQKHVIDESFITTYERWLFSNKDYSINNLDKNKFYPYVTLGTTQTFHDFYQIHFNKKLKIKRGEYPYHKAFFNSINKPWGWIDDEGITSNDFVIVSYPFSGNGSTGKETREVLDLCNKHAVPVLLDCAFWGLSEPLSLYLNQYPCIKIISFSLSKFFSIGRLRIGMMYSQYKNKASAAILAPYRYINSWSAYIGLQLINAITIEYMYKTYQPIQKKICKYFGIAPSETLIFGIGKGDRWQEFQRDGAFNRICLSQAIYEKYKEN